MQAFHGAFRGKLLLVTPSQHREYKQVLQNIVDAEEMIKNRGGVLTWKKWPSELKDAKAEKEYEEKTENLAPS